MALFFYLQRSERVVLEEGQPNYGHQQELHTKCVVLRVVAAPKAHVDQVHCSIGKGQEHHLRMERSEKRQRERDKGYEYKVLVMMVM